MAQAMTVQNGDRQERMLLSILIDLLQHLQPANGDFWFLSNQAGVGAARASKVARSWLRENQSAGIDSPLHRTPLWRFQQPFLEKGKWLDAEGIACQVMTSSTRNALSLHWVFCHQKEEKGREFSKYFEEVKESFRHGASWSESNHRCYQIQGKSNEILQELAYLGGVRTPGVCLVRGGDAPEELSRLMYFIETLLIRKFWVILPLRFQGLRAPRENEQKYRAFYNRVCELRFPGLIFQLASSGQPNERPHEVWVISPGQSLEHFQNIAHTHLRMLLESEYSEDMPIPLEHQLRSYTFPEHHRLRQKITFESSFPRMLEDDLELGLAQRRELEEVISLWEQLMDEHARFDEHFTRRPLARLYLRRSFGGQLEQPTHLLLLIRSHFKVVGFLSAQIMHAPLFQESRVGQIVDMFLLPQFRNAGIGSKMVECAIEWFGLQEVEQIDLNVAVHNEQGKHFWEKHGFKPYLRVVSRAVHKENS